MYGARNLRRCRPVLTRAGPSEARMGCPPPGRIRPFLRVNRPRRQKRLLWPLHPLTVRRQRLLMAGAVVGLAVGAYLLVPRVETALNTVSTDDAYVNGHVTLVAPRVTGQVMKVFVDDNCRVKKGAMLVQLDKEPYEIQVAIKKAAVVSAEADLVAANALARALVAAARANRFMLQHAIEDVNTQTAGLRACRGDAEQE